MIGFVFKNSCSPDSVSLLKPFARFLHAHIHKRQQVAMGKVSRTSTPVAVSTGLEKSYTRQGEAWDLLRVDGDEQLLSDVDSVAGPSDCDYNSDCATITTNSVTQSEQTKSDSWSSSPYSDAASASTTSEEECSTAVAEKDSLEGWKVFKGWDMPDIREIVVSFCAPSPSLKWNQIAVADRRFNTTWRRGLYALCTKMLRSAIRSLQPRCRHCIGGESILLLIALEDIFNTRFAAAEYKRKISQLQENTREARRLYEMVVEELAHSRARASLLYLVGANHMANGRFHSIEMIPRTPRGPRGSRRRCWCAPDCGGCRPRSPASESTEDEPPVQGSDEGSGD